VELVERVKRPPICTGCVGGRTVASVFLGFPLHGVLEDALGSIDQIPVIGVHWINSIRPADDHRETLH